MKQNEILLKHGKKGLICRALKVSYPTVQAALSGNCNSAISLKIRKVAVEQFGGVLVENDKNDNLKK